MVFSNVSVSLAGKPLAAESDYVTIDVASYEQEQFADLTQGQVELAFGLLRALDEVEWARLSEHIVVSDLPGRF